jgi:uncharacterized protein YdaU (DUF1376 family)
MSFVQHGMPLLLLCMNKRNDISPNRRLLASLGPATNKPWFAVRVTVRFFVQRLKE